SLAVTRRDFSGGSNSISQKPSQTKPHAPRTTKAVFHPKLRNSQGTTKGAKIEPTFEPALNIPVATDRSFGGNHSVTVLIAAGKLPASPRPSATRATPNPKTVRINACAIAARLQKVIENAYVAFVPN